ncbi:molybdenum cofactor biosynthesis protein A [Segniliparus rotundus DSM 44985]|uniref:GTP 3',8-cyclase n=1 Tax=Segniliparus rotundus (strain ATCC BAA-972 / CDC 1076 / CIP 108378 / DSM 44985 / JCM 13578) TaxID=640132 RepID=D6ZDN1_SEGRD|nr:molybdenum cofactor biosynthesis protein A [Segniliparus rotundus DSM 44985]
MVALGFPGSKPRDGDARFDGMPRTGPMLDRFGRRATDLRISLTDRCNLRCTYCMPEEGMQWLPGEDLLTVEEIVRLVRIAVTKLHVAEVRFTGGEPLLHKDLPTILRLCSALRPRAELSITTNGLGLRQKAQMLADCGLDRLNVSLDAADPVSYAESTRRDRFHDVLAGLAAASAAGLRPIKVNAVLTRRARPSGQGGADSKDWRAVAVELLELCLAQGFELRFIEQMPLDAGRSWSRAEMIRADEIVDALGRHRSLTPDRAPRGSAPASRWLVDGGPARVGVIASVTKPFCADCDRTRVTADGQVRNCLFAAEETDLRAVLRSSELAEQDGDAAVELLWRQATWMKRAGHGMDEPWFEQPERPMSAIGG